MTSLDAKFSGSIPALYDHYLGPLIFEPYAVDLAERVAKLKPRDILETAAGTGIVTLELAKRMPAASITATDLNPAMLEVAAKKVTGSNIKWQPADALALPFADQSFDVVACQFGVMFFPDKLKAYREVHRVLRPGGQFLFNVWDSLDHNDMASVVNAAAAEMFPGNPPEFFRRTPHGYNDVEAITALLREAGFAAIFSHRVAKRSRAGSPRDPAIGFVQGTPLRSEIEARGTSMLEKVTDAAADALARRFGQGPVEGAIQAIVFEAAR